MKDLIWKKGENSHGIYWGYGQDITIKEANTVKEANRFLCLTCLTNNCKHVREVRIQLHTPLREVA